MSDPVPLPKISLIAFQSNSASTAQLRATSTTRRSDSGSRRLIISMVLLPFDRRGRRRESPSALPLSFVTVATNYPAKCGQLRTSDAIREVPQVDQEEGRRRADGD